MTTVALTHTNATGIMIGLDHLAPEDAGRIITEGCPRPKCIRHTLVAKIEGRWMVRTYPQPVRVTA